MRNTNPKKTKIASRGCYQFRLILANTIYFCRLADIQLLSKRHPDVPQTTSKCSRADSYNFDHHLSSITSYQDNSKKLNYGNRRKAIALKTQGVPIFIPPFPGVEASRTKMTVPKCYSCHSCKNRTVLVSFTPGRMQGTRDGDKSKSIKRAGGTWLVAALWQVTNKKR